MAFDLVVDVCNLGIKKLVADTVGLLLLDKKRIDLVDAIAERLKIVDNEDLNMTGEYR